MRKIALCLAVSLLVTALAGCGGGRNSAPGVQAVPATAQILADEDIPAVAAPLRAVEAIHESQGGSIIDRVYADRLEEVFGIPSDMVIVAAAYVSEAIGGLCDVVIVKPVPGSNDQVREALHNYATMRADSFRNYDILDSYSIASNAIVFDQGDFVVMLMLPDNDAAREIIDLYIPLS